MIALLLGKIWTAVTQCVTRRLAPEIRVCVARRLICPLCKLTASVNEIAAL